MPVAVLPAPDTSPGNLTRGCAADGDPTSACHCLKCYLWGALISLRISRALQKRAIKYDGKQLASTLSQSQAAMAGRCFKGWFLGTGSTLWYCSYEKTLPNIDNSPLQRYQRPYQRTQLVPAAVKLVSSLFSLQFLSWTCLYQSQGPRKSIPPQWKRIRSAAF